MPRYVRTQWATSASTSATTTSYVTFSWPPEYTSAVTAFNSRQWCIESPQGGWTTQTLSLEEWLEASDQRAAAERRAVEIIMAANSPERARARERAAADWEARERAASIERARAIERAELLLRESLSAPQYEELNLHGRFTLAVTDKQGRPRIFVLRRGRVANILELNAQGGSVARWCVHPRLDVPDADTMLAQKLWLENDCDELLRIANRHPI